MGKLDALTAAQLSAAAYPDWKQSGQSLPEGWSAGPTFVSQSGNNSITVFFNPSTGQAVLAFKGSDNLSNFKSDLLDSGAAAWNETKPLALQALAAATSAGYETSNISTDGHSLGGGMAQTFALEKGPLTKYAKRLDAPAKDLPRLRRLLTEPDVFARSSAAT